MEVCGYMNESGSTEVDLPSSDSLDITKKFPMTLMLDNISFTAEESREDTSINGVVLDDYSETKQENKKNGNEAIIENVINPSTKIYKSKYERKILDPHDVIEEMRQTYENEISVLKKQLQQVGLHGISSEDTLIKRCNMLELQLTRSRNESEAMSEQIVGLKIQLQAWPDKIRQIEDENETFRARVEDLRAINRQKQNEIDWLHENVKTLEAKFWNQSSGSGHQEKIFLKQLMNEYDILVKDYNRLNVINIDNERKVCEIKTEIHNLLSELIEYQREVRNLKDENDLLKRNKTFDVPWAYGDSYLPQIYHHSKYLLGDVKSHNSTKLDSPIRDKMLETHVGYSEYKDLKKCIRNVGDNTLDQSKENTENIYITKSDSRILEFQKGIRRSQQIDIDAVTDTNDDWMTRRFRGYDTETNDDVRTTERKLRAQYGDHNKCQETLSQEDIDLSMRYEHLQKEKKKLLINLSHIPITSAARYKRTNKDERESLEAQLDHIERQLGVTRMAFKRKTVIK